MKATLHKISRHSFTLGLEIGAFIILAALLAWLALVWRLSQGPINLDFLTDRMAGAINAQQQEYVVHFGTAQLTGAGYKTPFAIDMINVEVTRPDKTPVLAIGKVGFELSKRYLWLGKFIPKTVTVYNPALGIVRAEDGTFSFNLGAQGQAPASSSPSSALFKEFIGALDERTHDQKLVLFALRKLSILGASIFFDDKLHGGQWKATKADIILARKDVGLIGSAEVDIDLDGESAHLQSTIFYGWEAGLAKITSSFKDVDPAKIASRGNFFKPLENLSSKLSGNFEVNLDSGLRLMSGRAVLQGGEGTLGIPGVYDTPVAIKGVKFLATLDAKGGVATLEQAEVNLGTAVATGSATYSRDGDDYVLAATARLEGLPTDEIKTYWPENLTPDPRAWVTGHLSKGVVTSATLDIALRSRDPKLSAPAVDRLEGDLAFTGLTVDYFGHLDPVTGVDGTAHYTKDAFTLDLTSGTLKDMKVSSSDIFITDLQHAQSLDQHAKIDITVDLAGPFRTALEVLDKDPLKYTSELGLKPEWVEGTADVSVNFKFPLTHGLILKDVNVGAKATLGNVVIQNIVSDLALTGGPFALQVDNDKMQVTGSGLVNGAESKIDWVRNFSTEGSATDLLKAKISADAALLHKLGIPDDLDFSGTLPMALEYEALRDHTALMKLEVDLTVPEFKVPLFNFQKTANTAGTLDAVLHFKDRSLERINGLKVASAGLAVEGDLVFARGADGALALQSASIGKFQMGESNFTITVGSPMHINVIGAVLDASTFFADKKPGEPSEALPDEKRVTPFTADIQVDRIITGKAKFIDQVKLFLDRNDTGRFDRFELAGISGAKPLTVRYMPAPAGGFNLNVTAENAGAALSALGVMDGVRGGKLVIAGVPRKNGQPRDMQGQVQVSRFALKDAPAIAQLLNALSLPGILQLLNGEGVSFETFKAGFAWVDHPAALDVKAVKSLHIDNGRTTGSSLGLTVEGTINRISEQFDLNGTIVPASVLNKLISNIPIIGDILSGGTDAVFAATYTITGPTNNPTVTVNPLAALAPGLLRKMFFEGN